MKHSHCRISGVIALVIIQLVIIPATQLLHVGCEHSRGADPAISDSALHAVDAVRSWCLSPRCCDHCERASVITDGRTDMPPPNKPIHQPHDENTCPVCLLAFAARLTTTAPLDVSASERIAELVVVNVSVVKPTPRYSVLSRGPPPTSCG